MGFTISMYCPPPPSSSSTFSIFRASRVPARRSVSRAWFAARREGRKAERRVWRVEGGGEVMAGWRVEEEAEGRSESVSVASPSSSDEEDDDDDDDEDEEEEEEVEEDDSPSPRPKAESCSPFSSLSLSLSQLDESVLELASDSVG